MNIFQDGIRLYKEGRYSEAVEVLHRVVSADHDNHKAWNALGVSLSKIGDLDQSIICFENALSLLPGNEIYRRNLVKAQDKLLQIKQILPIPSGKEEGSAPIPEGEAPAAGPAGHQSPGREGDTPGEVKNEASSDLLNRGLSLFGQASFHDMPELCREALEYTDRSIELDPENFEAWQLKVAILTEMGKGDPRYLSEALTACDRALSLRPGQASMLFNKGTLLERIGDYDGAVQAFDQAYSHSSEEPMRLGIILMKKAEALESLGKESPALQTYEQIPVTDRFFGEAMEKRAGYLEKAGNRAAAVAAYRTAGLSHIKQEQFHKAIHSFELLLALSPDDEEAVYNTGVASYALYEQTQGREYLEDALSAFTTALAKDPENISYLIQKGRCLLDLGRFEEGLLFLDRALWINPSDGITLMNKGIALYQLSRHDEAVKYFDLVTTYYPEHSAPWLMKSRIHLEKKIYDVALMEIDQAIKLAPEDPRAWEQKAVILRALGREEEARLADEKSRVE